MNTVSAAAAVLGRIRYRAWQYLRGLRAALAVDEIGEVRQRLSAAEFDLFLMAGPRDRRHSVDLFHLLQREGIAGEAPSDDVLVAALLHDVGKGNVTVVDRIAFVILNATSDRLARWCERERRVGRQSALWRLRHHAELGAEMLEAVGTSRRVIELVRRHTDAPPDGDTSGEIELAAFIAADGRV